MTVVNLYDFFPYTWILHFVRAFVFFNVTHTVLKNKYNTFVTFFSIMISGMLYSYFSLLLANGNNEIFIMVFYYVFLFGVIALTTKGNLFSKLFVTVFGLAAYLCSTLSYEMIKSILNGFAIRTGLNSKVFLADLLADTLFVFSGSFIFTFIIKLIKQKTKHSFSYKSKLSFLFLFPVTHIFSAFITYTPFLANTKEIKEYYDCNPTMDIFIILFSVICMIIDISIIFIIDYMEKVEETNIENERKLIKNQLDYQQMMLLKDEKKEFRKIKHDFVNILTTAKGFIEIGKPEKALSILTNTNDDLLGLAGFSICSNETINTIIYIKQQQAKSNDIQFASEISENYSVMIDDYDLCRLLNNIIDNSLNAVYPLKNNKVCKLYIDINQDKIVIKSENGFADVKQTEKKKKSDEHGNGINIIKEIAKKYGGGYRSKHFDQVWYTETFLDNKKPANSDPPPRILA